MDEPELTCQELVELVTEYFENALLAEERSRFERHLETCPHCRTYLEQMRLTIRALGRLPPDAWPAGARDMLLEHFRRWKAEADPSA